jgi:DNA-binding NarL/FixJ family response regulator
MPVMSGIEATERIKTMHPATAVLILTAHDDDQYVFALLKAGAAGYLLKDVPSAEVVRAVRLVHAGEPVLHPTIARKVLARFSSERSLASESPQMGGEPPGAHLTDRELEVLRLAASGMTNAQIASSLFFSVRTVQVHMTHIFDKLEVGSRTEAVITGLKRGLISLEHLHEG